MVPSAIRIYETYNPGAVNKVSVFNLEGKEVTVWKGDDPTPIGSGKCVSEIPLKVKFKTNLVKIYLNSTEVEGWNEIDAVGLVDADGKTQWAAATSAEIGLNRSRCHRGCCSLRSATVFLFHIIVKDIPACLRRFAGMT